MKKLSILLGLWLSIGFGSLAQAQTVTLGKAATFRAKTSNAQQYIWTFPGNIVINGEVVQFTFTEPGPQEVHLRVIGFDNNTNEITKRVLVANDGKPTAVIEATVDGQEVLNSVVEANLSESINLISNSFFGDKSDKDLTKQWTVNGRTYQSDALSGVFDAVGNYQVALTVADPANQNLVDKDTLQVRIINQPPEVSGLSVVPIEAVPGQMQLLAQAQDADGTIGSYRFEALEGGKSVLSQIVNTPETILDLSRFAGLHNYQFRVTVTDDRFDTDTFTTPDKYAVDPNSSNQAPTVTISALPGNQGMAGDFFSFTAEAVDPDGDILDYDWTLSNGQRFFTPQIETRFNTPGTYQLTLKVSDGLVEVSDEMTITIAPKPTAAETNQAPVVNLEGVLPGNTGGTSTVFRFYLAAEDPDNDSLTYEWDFGNGTQSFLKNAAILYQEPGTYNVSVTVSDGLEEMVERTSITVEAGEEVESESLEDLLARLQEQQAELAAQALDGQGQMTPEQVELVAAIDGEMEGLILAAESTNDVAAQAAQERLQAIADEYDAAIALIREAEAEQATLDEVMAEILEAQRVAAEAAALLESTADTNADIRNTLVLEGITTRTQTLEQEAVALSQITLSTQGQLTQEQQTLVDAIDEDLGELITAAREGNAQAARDAQLILDARAAELDARIVLLQGDVENLKQETLSTQGQLSEEQQILVDNLNDGFSDLIEEAITGNQAARDRAAVIIDQSTEALQNRSEQLAAEAALLEEATLAMQGQLTEEQTIIVTNIDARLGDLIQAAQEGNAEAKAEAQLRLNQVQNSIDTRIKMLDEEAAALEAARLAVQGELTPEQDALVSSIDEEFGLLAEQARNNNAAARQAIAARNVVLQEALSTEINSLAEESEALRVASLGRQGLLTPEQEALVESIDSELFELMQAAQAGNAQAQERLEARTQALRDQRDELIETRTTEAQTLQDATLAIQGELTEEQAVLVGSIDAELEALMQQALEGNQTAKAAALERLETLKQQSAANRSALTQESDALRDATLVTQGELSEEQIALLASIDEELAALIEEANNGNAAAKAKAQVILDQYKTDLVTHTQTLMDESEALRLATLASQGTLTDTQKAIIKAKDASLLTLIGSAQDRNSQAKAEAQRRIEIYRLELDTKLAELNEILANKETLGEAVVRLQQEQDILALQVQAAREQARTNDAAMLEAQREDLAEMLGLLHEAQANKESLASLALRLNEEQTALEMASMQVNAVSREEAAAAMNAKKDDLNRVITELNEAKNNQESLGKAALRLNESANLARINSTQFNEASKALAAQNFQDQQAFTQARIDELTALRANPVDLPSLGISRQEQETLEERLERLQNSADRASLEAAERQRVAAELAAVKQDKVLEALAAVKAQLIAEQDEQKRAVLQARIEALEAEAEALESVRNPGQILTAQEIQARTESLKALAQSQKAEVIKQQQEYIAQRLAQVEDELALVTDIDAKEALEAERKKLLKHLEETELIVDYQAQLEASKTELNQRLAGNLNSTAELLVRTQLESIEGKLTSLEKLAEANQAVATFETESESDPVQIALEYLSTEQASLEAELKEIQTDMESTKDPIAQKSLGLREAEIKAALERIPTVESGTSNTVTDLPITQVIDYLKHYRALQVRALEGEAKTSPTISAIDQQIATLQRLHNSGYSPQTRLTRLLLDLEGRETELLNQYRTTEDEAALEALKTKLVVLGEARDQLTGLEGFGIDLSGTVYDAREQLKAVHKDTTNAYLKATSTAEKALMMEKLEAINEAQQWLDRFYNPERRRVTLSDLEASLMGKVAANDIQAQNDLADIKLAEANLTAAIEAQVRTDFENFKTNLRRQALQVSDEEEKADLEARIDALKYEDFAASVAAGSTDLYESVLADITISAHTNLFLYADVPLTSFGQPLLFEWNMGDGQTRFGQNVNHEYYEPGFYRVLLTLSDGQSTEEDLFTVRVLK